VFRVSSSKHHVSISAVAQKVNLGNLGVRNAMRPNERARCRFCLGDSWRKRGFAVVVRYAIVTITLTLPTAVHSMQKRMLSIQLPTHPNIIVNIGASHHIVANKGLLTSLQSIPTKSGVIGNGT